MFLFPIKCLGVSIKERHYLPGPGLDWTGLDICMMLMVALLSSAASYLDKKRILLVLKRRLYIHRLADMKEKVYIRISGRKEKPDRLIN